MHQRHVMSDKYSTYTPVNPTFQKAIRVHRNFFSISNSTIEIFSSASERHEDLEVRCELSWFVTIKSNTRYFWFGIRIFWYFITYF